MSVEAKPAVGMWVMLVAVVLYFFTSVEGSPGAHPPSNQRRIAACSTPVVPCRIAASLRVRLLIAGHQLIHQQLHPADAQPTHYLVVLPRPITDCCKKTRERPVGGAGGASDGVQSISTSPLTNSPARR
jgi:hypothetical protein